MLWPNGSRTQPQITSPFGKRKAPVAGASTFHRGTDFRGWSSIRAVADGIVVAAGTPAGWAGGGNQVWVQHNGYLARYLHLASRAVKIGQRVVTGQNLGVMGRTGNVSGVHLHFEIVVNGVQIDPVPFVRARLSAPASTGGEWPARALYGEAHVRSVQEKANRLGAKLDVDGKDGPGTQTWVRSFQASHGLTADGVAGPLTVTAMDVALNAAGGKLTVDGNFGSASITALQRALGVEPDGQLGPVTIQALQRALGVTADGILGSGTTEALQKLLGVEPDGDWGPATSRALQEWLNAGKPIAAQVKVGRNDTSRPTADIQRLVGANPDGDYGADTTAKVIAWQKANGLDPDGVWGPASDAKGFPTTPPAGNVLDPAAPWKEQTPDSALATWVGSPNYNNSSTGKGAKTKTHIDLHWFGTDSTLAGTDAHFQNPGEVKNGRGTGASSQYGIGADGTVHQYVLEKDYAHTNGTYEANATGITIEHEAGPGKPATDTLVQRSAELCADIARRRGWAKLEWMVNVFPHRHFVATECPGTLDTARIIATANALLTVKPTPTPDPAPDTVPVERSWLQAVADRIKQLLGGGK